MTDSDRCDDLRAKHERNRQERLEAVTRWVEYIRENPPEVWGPQQIRLIDTQLESARRTALPAEHVRRVEAFGRLASRDAAEDDSDS